jgi:3-hydroxyisobutyrate dehydrogenase-like beta-hydroxyacid dehydrogenase
MASITVGLLYPGEMGSAVGACARAHGARVLWVGEGRSERTRVRADAAGLEDAKTLAALVAASDVVLSICPPRFAVDVARAVASHGFAGLYMDANAVAPATARQIGAIVELSGAAFVDGGIVGQPPQAPGLARLFLSGSEAGRVASLFQSGNLEAVTLNDSPGAASALKMAYAAYSKGNSALLIAIRALAVREGVDDALLREWERSQPGLSARSEQAVRNNARKAWRFVEEMEEIAASFGSAGLPGGFHQAAAEIYRRMERYKDTSAPPSVAEVITALTKPGLP